jgi:4-amino-4-deoxy-L-arabinose transferase-like glycosyltransferase
MMPETIQKSEGGFLYIINRGYTRLIEAGNRHERILLLSVFLLALICRIVLLFFYEGLNSPPIYDEVLYDTAAQNIVAGNGYRSDYGLTAAKPPIFPYFLAGVYLVAGPGNFKAARLIQIFIDSFSCILIYFLGKMLAGRAVGWVAALISVVYPLNVYMSLQLYPETTFFILLVLMLIVTFRMGSESRIWPAVIGGILFGVCILARPNIALLLPFILVYPFLIKKKASAGQAILYLFATFFVILPWSIRNYLVFKEFIPLTSEAGAVFWSDNHPMAKGGTVIPGKATWPGDDFPDRNWAGWSYLTEPQSNDKFMQAGMEWVKTHPVDFLALIPMKIARLWNPAVFTTHSDRYASPLRKLMWIPYLPFLALAAAGVIFSLKNWKTWWLLYSILISTNITTVLFAGGTRYSIPMVPALLIFSSLGLLELLIKIPGIESSALKRYVHG